MSAEVTALLVTDDDDEARRFVDAVAEFAMSWSSNVSCAASLRMATCAGCHKTIGIPDGCAGHRAS